MSQVQPSHSTHITHSFRPISSGVFAALQAGLPAGCISRLRPGPTRTFPRERAPLFLQCHPLEQRIAEGARQQAVRRDEETAALCLQGASRVRPRCHRHSGPRVLWKASDHLPLTGPKVMSPGLSRSAFRQRTGQEPTSGQSRCVCWNQIAISRHFPVSAHLTRAGWTGRGCNCQPQTAFAEGILPH